MINFDVGSTRAHQDLNKQFIKAVSAQFPAIIVIPYTVGVFRDFDTAARIIHAGIKGIPDIIVIGKGFYLFFDCKTGKAKFTKEQLAFKKRVAELNDGQELVYKLGNVDQGLNVIKNAIEFYERN